MIDWARERETELKRQAERNGKRKGESNPSHMPLKSMECPELKFQTEKTGEGSRVAENEVNRIEAPKPRGRAFQISAEEAKDVPNVVSENSIEVGWLRH
ncbi:hypothetical protein L1987_32998 [Smallanthus sonchifolius]|uniref:Uncharacterized protein n=1 Tax=Smallanthus sonchifolius TaxID=185202 RepID=A0ACB9HRI6_9ASTR|nr:hypothetical protein L1987_32998 [Smallanthus sonchifolius]